ncbi:MAG: 1-deoxy-D-xylulose-5-phosphate reductoisomerase [Gemmatimonadota bacterium]|jgi:1-deoxy-D-xylulose-5-phosphate reductoisomerase
MTDSATGVVLLGATGSIGRATIRVIGRHRDRFRIVAMTAGSRGDALDELAAALEPDYVVLARRPSEPFVPGWSGEWRFGGEAVAEAAADPRAELVVNALVGYAGLESTLAALKAGHRLALANKESLVAGGELVLDAWRHGRGELVPVDSEHSAIHQCLAGRPALEISRLILTASGGPFRALPSDRFAAIRPEDALAHPTWSMGEKITIDSATMANKALEVIEAHLLFDVPYEKIDIVVHPSSIVHSFVEFRDGSTMAQMGQPSMEVPILYALSGPERLPNEFQSFDPIADGPLEFEELRAHQFPMFGLGVAAGRAGGTQPAAYNAANEVAVRSFLDHRLSFPGIAAVVEDVLSRMNPRPVTSIEDVEAADFEARALAREAVYRVR